VIAGRYRGRAPARPSVWITGRSVATGGHREQLAAREALTGADAAALAAVWARGRVRDLEDLYVTGGQSSEIEREIIGVSKRFSVLSRFTAFLAVDRREVVNPGGEVRTVTQAVEMPAGWAMKEEQESEKKRSKGGGGGWIAGGQHLQRSGARGGEASPPAQAMAAPMSPPMGGPADKSHKVASPKPAARPLASAPPSPGSFAPPPAAAQAAPRRPRGVGGLSGPGGQRVRREAEERAIDSAPQVGDAPYRARLVQIAEAIDAALAGPPGQLASGLGLALVRLTEWIEDTRSVGLDALITAITPIADQLALAVRDDQQRAQAATEAARRLRELATGSTPTTPRPGRVAFWK